MQEFFTNTLASRYIKNLLANSNVPNNFFVSDNDYLVDNLLYYYNGFLIRCTKSGYLSDNYEEIPIENYVNNNINKSGYTSVNSYYDSYTHEKLGEYLRYYKSKTNIDLMPFYNCFSNRFCDNIELSKNSYKFVDKLDSNKKLAIIPIKFDRHYTIALDSCSPVLIKALFYNVNSIIDNFDINSLLEACIVTTSLDKYTVEHIGSVDDDFIVNSNKPLYISRTFFNKPFTFKISLNVESMTDATKRLLKNYEKYLYLLVQLDECVDSSITVLEGNYIKSKNSYVYNFGNKHLVIEGVDHYPLKELEEQIILKNNKSYYNFLNSNIIASSEADQFKHDFSVNILSKLTNKSINLLLLSDLSLLLMNSRKSFAFSDRLIEYLVDNVITGFDDNQNNIIYANKYLSKNYSKYNDVEWSLDTRYCYYALYMKSLSKLLDINGFIDKDIESKYLLED